jgi:hypothetical protein
VTNPARWRWPSWTEIVALFYEAEETTFRAGFPTNIDLYIDLFEAAGKATEVWANEDLGNARA